MARLRFLPAVTVLATSSMLCGSASAAEREPDPLCLLVLHERANDRDDLALQVDLARSRLTAAEQIFELVDGLWKNDAIDRITHLAAKHDRDVAAIERERAQVLLARQDALLDQFRLRCRADPPAEDLEENRRALEEAYRRYARADCEALSGSMAVAEVDLTFRREKLASVLDLRRNDVATRQDVIFAERDVEMSETTLVQARQRVERCRSEIAAFDEP